MSLTLFLTSIFVQYRMGGMSPHQSWYGWIKMLTYDWTAYSDAIHWKVLRDLGLFDDVMKLKWRENTMNCIVQEDIWRKQEELVSILSHRKQQVVFCFYNSYIIFTWIFYKVYKNLNPKNEINWSNILVSDKSESEYQKVKEIESLQKKSDFLLYFLVLSQQTLIFYCISLYCPNKLWFSIVFPSIVPTQCRRP